MTVRSALLSPSPLIALAMGTVLLGEAAVASDVVQERIETQHHALRLVRLADGLAHPWAVAALPDERFLVTERDNGMALVENGEIRRLDGLPEFSNHGQGGMLDVVLHPQFGDGANDWIYFTFSKPGEGDDTASALARARLEGNSLTDLEELFVQDRFSQPGRHYGSRLAWHADGSLMMSIGDRGAEPPRAQDKQDHAGSVLRLTETGEAHSDNPFIDDPAGLDEIYSIGNRNIQGMTVTQDDSVWASEHGPRTGDELNRIEAGVNYGWPVVTLGNDYATNEPFGEKSRPGMRDPVLVFEGRYAPSGLAVVSSDLFPEWSGDLLAGGLGSEKLARIAIDGDTAQVEELLLEGEIGRIRDVRQGPDGTIYLLNDEAKGGLYRLERAE
ncbi:PQQ-dependent sugar dehydrogenase [Litchfieldella xinjiangensis]|uniref:PQQ-dependent sugar dehydrogenase n=1 Tax=Litchfieldella xinjiangensis TaxID=1166948 RepID=UPI0005BAF0A3|nr:PQQ-dependent sugar dehydrogenase [Halomonas xinjiangensis]